MIKAKPKKISASTKHPKLPKGVKPSAIQDKKLIAFLSGPEITASAGFRSSRYLALKKRP